MKQNYSTVLQNGALAIFIGNESTGALLGVTLEDDY